MDASKSGVALDVLDTTSGNNVAVPAVTPEILDVRHLAQSDAGQRFGSLTPASQLDLSS